jgi:hypothetical protein
MVDARIPFYPHRQNRDGSFDSICLKCFATVARAKVVTELKSYETKHICDEAFLAERGVLRPSTAA